MKIGQHPRGRLISDLNGGLQNALGDDVGLGDWGRLGRHVDSVCLVAALTVLLQHLLQFGQPLGYQVDILGNE